MMVAAHPFDLEAAQREGFRTAFLHRPGEASMRLGEAARSFHVVARDFDELVAKLGAESTS